MLSSSKPETKPETSSSSISTHYSDISILRPSASSSVTEAASSAAKKIELTLDDVFLKSKEDLTAVTAVLDSSFNKVVIQSKITGTSLEIAKEVEKQFNLKIDPNKSAFGTTMLSTRGETLNDGEAFLGSCNGVYEIRTRQEDNKFFAAAKYIQVGVKAEELKRVNIKDPVIGGNGRYVINVPMGKYALTVGTGNERKIYGPGVHVIHDPNFVYNPKDDLIDQNQPYINRGIMHIIRVVPGKMAKITINGKPRLLLPQEEPYIFFDANFKTFNPVQDYVDVNQLYINHGQIHVIRVPNGLVAKVTINGTPHLLTERKEAYVFDDPTFYRFDAEKDYASLNNPYIHHGQIHVLRVPANKIAKIIINGIPQLLAARRDPYVFCDPTFQVFKPEEHYCNVNDNWIQHGNILILRVPAGKVLKIWDNSEPVLLEHRKEPYEYQDPNVILAGQNYQGALANATDAVIEHGSIKRIITSTGFKTPIYEGGGKLRILLPSSEPELINDGNCRVGKPIPDAVQNMYIPANKLEWLTVSTNDSLQINIQLAVAYQIVDPEKALRDLGVNEIELHIQRQAIAFMTSEIKRHSSTDFLRNNKRPDDTHKPGDIVTTADQQEHVLKQLQTALQEYGLKVTQLSIERIEYPDKDIAKEMGQQSLVSAKTAGEVAVLNQKSQLSQAEARNKAEQARIALEQANNAKILTAETNLQEAKLVADAKKATADREAEIKMIGVDQQNKAKLDTAKYELEVAKVELEKAKVNLEKTKTEAEAVKVMGAANASAESARLTAMAEAFSINPQLAAYLSTQQLALAITKAQGLTLTSPELVQLMMPLGLTGNPSALFSQANRGSVAQLRVLDDKAENQLLERKAM